METKIVDFITGKFKEIQTRVPVKLNGFSTESEPVSFESQLKNIDSVPATDVLTEEHAAVESGLGKAMATVIFPNIKPAPIEIPSEAEETIIYSDNFDETDMYLTENERAELSANIDYINQYSDAETQSMIMDAISKAANDYGVNESLIKAIIMQESAFSPTSLSQVGAQGLMQLMPETADYLGISNPWDIYKNVDGGTRLISDYLENYDGDLQLVLAAYNAGPGAVSKYNGVPPYTETQDYVKKVIGYYNQYLNRY